MAAIQFSNSFIVNAPTEKAFALMADVPRHPEIFTINQGIRNYHGGPVQEGDTWVSEGKFRGQETVTHYTMAEYEEPTHLHFKMESPSGDGSISWNFTAVEDGTQVEQFVEGEPKGFFCLTGCPAFEGKPAKTTTGRWGQFQAISRIRC